MYSISEIKEHLLLLKKIKNGRYGYFGENIFSWYMAQHHEIKKLHKHGADFLIDNNIKIDVKTRLMLGKNSESKFTKISKNHKVPNTIYAYVLILDIDISIWMENSSGTLENITRISWDDAKDIFNTENFGSNIPKATTIEQTDSEAIIEDLRNWLSITVHKKAKFVVRHNKKTQDAMCASGWGPEAFFHDPIKNRGKIDIVILIFFDNGNVYDLFCYPISEHNKIHFVSKKVGPNLNNRMTFSPKELSERYKFSSIEEFKRDVSQRFYGS